MCGAAEHSTAGDESVSSFFRTPAAARRTSGSGSVVIFAHESQGSLAAALGPNCARDIIAAETRLF